MTTNPIAAANQIQMMASKTPDARMATAMTVMSVALLATMLVKEAKELFKTNKFDRNESSRHQRG